MCRIQCKVMFGCALRCLAYISPEDVTLSDLKKKIMSQKWFAKQHFALCPKVSYEESSGSEC